MLRSYPWNKVERGQGFFVPALDLAKEREAGLRAAVQHHLTDARAVYTISTGRLGVLFYRLPPVSPSPA
jgi:hypothetical protein